jgi:hypothetical protein
MWCPCAVKKVWTVVGLEKTLYNTLIIKICLGALGHVYTSGVQKQCLKH